MPEVVSTTPVVEPRPFDPGAMTRLRSLSRPRPNVKTFVKSISPMEVASVVLLVMIVVGTFLIYSFWILPDQVRGVQLSSEVRANDKKIEELRARVVDPSAVTSQFQEVKDSLDTFRGSILQPRLVGKQEILQAIDRSVKETGVSFASSVQFNTDEAQSIEESSKRKRSKDESGESAHGVASYPALEATMSIAGTYGQLRSFISRFEGGKQFVVINSVSLSSQSSAVPTSVEPGGPPRRATRSGPLDAITLELHMTAYFQPESGPGAPQP